MIKLISFLFLCLFFQSIHAQGGVDDWMTEQLGEVTWLKTYEGALADYHPVTIILASDQKEMAGYLIHKGDPQKHRLLGEWSDNRLFQLQERDDHGRLTGYLTGKIKDDQLDLKWISVNQDRLFEIHATTEKLVKINKQAPVAEWIVISSVPSMAISVQKIGNGRVAGFVINDQSFMRFEGACMDGSCSIWKASCRDASGKEVNLQMLQKSPLVYKATFGDQSYTANVAYSSPLELRLKDHSAGFIDLIYPKLESSVYNNWIDSFWISDTRRLAEAGMLDGAPRLAYRSSGWVELVDETDDYVSGMVTFLNPTGSHREAFMLLKKEGQIINPKDLLNAPEDFSKGAEMALASADQAYDKVFYAWLENVGYSVLIPTGKGLVMATEFNTIYGDELRLLSKSESKSLIRKKYWKYFGW